MIRALFSKFADNTNPLSESSRLRAQRFGKFLKCLGVTERDRILDVGGAEATWLGSGLERNVTLLNLSFSRKMPVFHYIEADACDMSMLDDRSFDVIFSNSVIEHVGAPRQIAFAREVRRVATRYWVQTPYKHFPIEPHFVFPFFQYFPFSVQMFIGKSWKYSHPFRNKEDVALLLSTLRLLTKREMRELFPEATIIDEKYFGITKSLIAYRR
jgi:hypothetical protein